MPVDTMREESGNEPVAAFSMSHPAVPALYMVLTLGLTMFSMQPVLIALSLAGGLASARSSESSMPQPINTLDARRRERTGSAGATRHINRILHRQYRTTAA